MQRPSIESAVGAEGDLHLVELVAMRK